MDSGRDAKYSVVDMEICDSVGFYMAIAVATFVVHAAGLERVVGED